MGMLLGTHRALLGGNRYVTPPPAFTFKPPFKITRGPTGAYGVNFDVATLAPTGTTYYVDQVAGNDAWPGTAAQPLKKVYTATGKADVDVVYVKPGLYTRTNGTGGRNMARSITIAPWPGEAGQLILSGHQDGLAWVLDGVLTNTYTTTRSSVGRVQDASIVDAAGDYAELTKQVDAATVDANPGSWYLDGSNVLWVRTADDRAPDADIWPQVDNCIRGTGDITICVMGAHLYGKNPAWLANSGAGQSPTLILKDCVLKYSVTNAVTLEGGTAYIQNCTAARNAGDGFNYHSLNAVVPQAIEINCTGRNNGTVNGAAIDNGSSMHNAGSVIRINGIYYENVGPNVIDIDNAEAWCLGCTARDSASDVPANDQGFSASPANMWLERCVASGQLVDLRATGTMYLRATTYTTSGGGGTITSY